jgi:hypothetical protein
LIIDVEKGAFSVLASGAYCGFRVYEIRKFGGPASFSSTLAPSVTLKS